MDEDRLKMMMRAMLNPLTEGKTPTGWVDDDIINNTKEEVMEETYREDLIRMYKERISKLDTKIESTHETMISYMKSYVEWYEERRDIRDKLERIDGDGDEAGG